VLVPFQSLFYNANERELVLKKEKFLIKMQKIRFEGALEDKPISAEVKVLTDDPHEAFLAAGKYLTSVLFAVHETTPFEFLVSSTEEKDFYSNPNMHGFFNDQAREESGYYVVLGNVAEYNPADDPKIYEEQFKLPK
jgi:hypothetical protein